MTPLERLGGILAAVVLMLPQTGLIADTQTDEPEGDAVSTRDESEGESRREPAYRLAPVTVEAVPQAANYGLDGRYRSGGSTFATGGTVSSLRDTPFSASILEEDFLKDSGLKRLDRTAQFVPGVQMGNLSSNTVQVFQSRGFQLGRDSILINGTRQADAFAITPEELVGKIEFYRGPSSILNGATPPGGAANIVTKKPLADPFVGFELDLDEHGERRFAADLNSGTLDPGVPLSLRFNAMAEDSETFRDAVERQVQAFAPVMTVDLTSRTRLTVEANLIDWEATDDRGLPLLGGNSDRAARRFERSDFLLGTTAATNDREQQRYMLDLSHRWSPNLRFNLQATLGETERSFFSVFPVFFDESSSTLARAHFGTEDAFDSVDVRADAVFNFETGPLYHAGIVAVQYRDFEWRDRFTGFVAPADSIDVTNPATDLPFLAADGPAGGLQIDQESRELLLQDAVTVTEGALEGLKLIGGARLIDFDDKLDSGLDEEQWVPRIGAGYTPPAAPFVTLYGNYAESFDPQSGVTAAGDPVAPQEGEQWEFGAKAELLAGDLIVSAAWFDLENRNVAVSDPDNPGAVVAVGRQRNEGLELELVGRIAPNLQARAQYAYSDSATVGDPARAGNELQLTPADSASAWLRYDVPGALWGSSRVVLTGGVVYVGDRFVDVDNSIELSAYTRVDLGARLHVGERTEVALDLLNAGDQRYFTGGNAFGLGSVLPGQTRTLALTLRHRL